MNLQGVRWVKSGVKRNTAWHVVAASRAATTLCHASIPDGATRKGVDLAGMRLSGCSKCYRIAVSGGRRAELTA